MTKEELHKMIGGQQIVSSAWICQMTNPLPVEGKYFRGEVIAL
jgi:hypothetical protein